MEETKIIYYLDDQETPYLVKLNLNPDKVTLKDFKNALNRQNYKYFFKSMDDDFGVVKEEVIDDDAKLPCFNGRVIAWLISTEGSVTSETKSQNSLLSIGNGGGGGGGSGSGLNGSNKNLNDTSQQGDQTSTSTTNLNTPMVTTINSSCAEQNIENGRAAVNSLDQHQEYRKAHRLRDLNDETTETESLVSTLRDLRLHRSSSRRHHNSFNHYMQTHRRSMKMPSSKHYHYDASSLMSSDLDTTTFFDTENDDQFSSLTESTTMSSKRYGMQRKKRLKHRMPAAAYEMDRASSVSSFTESTMSLNIITVVLSMEQVNFLGISIVGQSNKGGDGGIYVGSIMAGGAVDRDGRIEPGDMILQVNDISFENMSNDDAVKVLREAVMKPGPIKLVVAKCWDPNPKGYFAISRQEPIRPIDPGTWVAHTAAMTGTVGAGGGGTMAHHGVGGGGGRMLHPSHSISTFGSNSSLTEIDGGGGGAATVGGDTRYGIESLNLTVNTDMETVVRAMSAPDSGLDIRDRNWLKLTIPNAFIGSDVVDWLMNHVEGFPDRRDARKYACNLLKYGFIRHTVHKLRFSEQCYYVFGDFSGGSSTMGGNLFTLNEESEDFDSVSEIDAYGGGGPTMKTMMPPPPPSYLSSSSTSTGTGSTTTTSGIVSQTEKNFNLYYPPINGMSNSMCATSIATSGVMVMGINCDSIMDNTDNHTYVTSGINSINYNTTTGAISNNYTIASSIAHTNNSGGSNASRTENRSIKSSISDNSSNSGGNASDIELLSSASASHKRHHHNQKHNNRHSTSGGSGISRRNNDSSTSINSYYQLTKYQQQTQALVQQQTRTLDKVPQELRESKQSFRMAMGNPCEFFVDVM